MRLDILGNQHHRKQFQNPRVGWGLILNYLCSLWKCNNIMNQVSSDCPTILRWISKKTSSGVKRKWDREREWVHQNIQNIPNNQNKQRKNQKTNCYQNKQGQNRNQKTNSLHRHLLRRSAQQTKLIQGARSREHSIGTVICILAFWYNRWVSHSLEESTRSILHFPEQ